MLNSCGKKRKEREEEVMKLNAGVCSRYDNILGPDGLLEALVTNFNAMAELRLNAEYGDYLASACAKFKRSDMEDIKWKRENLNWQAVAKKLTEEEEMSSFSSIPTPWVYEIEKAAKRLEYDPKLVRYQIHAYADRNNFCHSGIQGMIDNCDFQELAERIVEDRRALEVIFRGRPNNQIDMRSVIKEVEREWFTAVVVDRINPSTTRSCTN